MKVESHFQVINDLGWHFCPNTNTKCHSTINYFLQNPNFLSAGHRMLSSPVHEHTTLVFAEFRARIGWRTLKRVSVSVWRYVGVCISKSLYLE